MENYGEVLKQAIRVSRQTGSRVRKAIDKKSFVQQFPLAGRDPRMAFTPEQFVMDITPLESITVGELRELCLAKREHPLALQKALSVQGLGDTQIVAVLREDLDVLRGKVVPASANEVPPDAGPSGAAPVVEEDE